MQSKMRLFGMKVSSVVLRSLFDAAERDLEEAVDRAVCFELECAMLSGRL